MIFSSYKFIFMFLPIVFLGYMILVKINQKRLSRVWLVLASLYFYAQGSKAFFPYFVGTILFNYLMGRLIIRCHEKEAKKLKFILLLIGLAENLGLLVYYKYMNFFIENINAISGSDITLRTIILPIGISFFSFQLIGYLVDSDRGLVKRYQLIDFLLFVTFFPQLIVGPIVHHKEIMSRLDDEKLFRINSHHIVKGLFVFSIGCAKKILIADHLISYAMAYYKQVDVSGFYESWLAVFAYTFAYYFDFSAYGDMAIGIGLLFNIVLPVNFNSPYKARNFAEFWRRWNMTLSQFLNDYIFKSIYKFGDRAHKLYFAVIITFIVSGIWHGAGWHYIIWGIVNGIFVCLAYMMTLNRKKMPFAMAWLLTFIGVLLTRVLFDSYSMEQAMMVYKSMFNIRTLFVAPKFFVHSGLIFVKQNLYTSILILMSMILSFGFKNTKEMLEDFKPTWQRAAFAGVLITLSLFRMGMVSDFLYFRF